MSINCTKAIIPVGGFGTRRLPITKAIEKCMLPVGNRPIVDYVVEDCIRAGITEIIFVVGEQSDQIRTYYGHNQLLEEYLADKGKQDELSLITDLSKKANFNYVVQDRNQPYGTAVPLWLCKEMIDPNESFIYVSGDQFYYDPGGGSEAAHLINEAERANATSVMMVAEVPHSEVYRYGIVKYRIENGEQLLEDIVEKPTVESAPSNLNNATFYLLNQRIFEFAEDYMKQALNTEYYVTDIVTNYSKTGNPVVVVPVKGEYLDCGNVEGWLHANNTVVRA
ncbi:MAG TPA: sugar phosphate nucleotidyltransferase [Patescibacteria group bacterium]|nr:sugar phosphate nucleotidyltransferase [Patescibacteria group bacterium]